MAPEDGVIPTHRPGPTTVLLVDHARRAVEADPHALVQAASRAVCVIEGLRGEGKSSLARTLLQDEKFQGVFVLPGPVLDEMDIWEAISTQIFEKTRQRLTESEDWMETTRTLVIIDDFLPRWNDEAVVALNQWKMMSLVLLTTPYHAANTQEALSTAGIQNVKKHRLAPLDKNKMLEFAKNHLVEDHLLELATWLTNNWWWAGAVLRFKGLIEPFCAAWKSGLIETVSTETELLWAITDCMTESLEKNGLPENALERWWTALGGLCRRSLETGYPMNASEVEYEARKIFPTGSKGVTAKHLLPALGESAGCCGVRWLSLPQPLMEFLTGLNVFHQNLAGLPIKSLVKGIADEDPVVVHVAGHLARAAERGTTPPEKQLIRLFRNLVLHMDQAKDRFSYTLRILFSSHIYPELLKYIVTDVDFTKVWDISDSAMRFHPVEALLEHIRPLKAEVTVTRGESAPEMPQVARLLAERGIFMFLADMNHLTFGNPANSDSLIHTIQKYGTKGVLQDFMGCLSSRCLNDLGKHITTQNLVCLRVRVTDTQSVKAACLTPESLSSLMWLEIDFDLPFDDLVKVAVPKVNTPLMDVTFRGLTDNDMVRLVAFLALIRKRYSGIHLMQSELSPEGARTFIKGLFSKFMKTSADPDAISRYRAWRYPIVGQSFQTNLSDEEARHLIGHDDRPQYNDNEVEAVGVVAERMEVLTLATFLGVLEDPACFRYECANFRVVKSLDGKVETKEMASYLG
ncbi:hypothetical protein E2C01_003471 [Portunus trituberculatus]|uniref:Uncharacterized protein n=1 Tax=Portunus trituberculatus TaxID=210409 RepID=A0A5B7CNW5_PORTR|nr:hypothetical protein [Portunus trituberculatus]